MHDPLKKRAHAGKNVSHENENNDGNKNAFGPRKSQSNGERPVLVCECSAAEPERSEAEIILDHLYEVFGRAVFLVIPRGSKKPANGGWQRTTFAQTQSGEYRAALLEAIRRGGNLGLLLGPASDNLGSIDIDDDELAEMFAADNPSLATAARTRGKRGCNFWLRPLPGTTYPNGQAVYTLKSAEGNDYGEFRVGGGDKGAQTVIFGIHPEGNRYQLSDGQVAQIDFAKIKWLGPWTKAEPPPKEAEHTGTPDFKKRIASYMAKVPVSVAGEHGDDQLWRAALLLVCGWGLSQTEALPYLRSFNARCLPSWPEARLVYKLKQADEKGTGVRGRLRDDQPNFTMPEQEANAQQGPVLEGFSPVEHLARGIREEDILVGDRFLERRQTLDLIAQSGVGKSSAAMQLFSCWACGMGGDYAFELNPFKGKPLRIVMIQNEDSLNDLYAQSMILNGIGFNKDQRELIHRNFKIFTVRGKLGLQATRTIRQILDKTNGCDILALNPMSAYAEGDLVRTEDCITFLYGLWSPLLDDYDCGSVLFLHTPKTTGARREAQKKWTTYDYMYSGAGAAIISNHARGIVTIDSVGNSTTFAWRVAKRFTESGWTLHTQHYKWKVLQDGCKLWVPASTAESAEAGKSSGKSLEDLYKLSPVIGTVPKPQFELQAMDAGFVRRVYEGVLAEALNDSTPDNLRLYEWSVYNPEGRAKVEISRSPQPPDQTHAAIKQARARERKIARGHAKNGES